MDTFSFEFLDPDPVIKNSLSCVKKDILRYRFFFILIFLNGVQNISHLALKSILLQFQKALEVDRRKAYRMKNLPKHRVGRPLR
jgi:hypothetical protein